MSGVRFTLSRPNTPVVQQDELLATNQGDYARSSRVRGAKADVPELVMGLFAKQF